MAVLRESSADRTEEKRRKSGRCKAAVAALAVTVAAAAVAASQRKTLLQTAGSYQARTGGGTESDGGPVRGPLPPLPPPGRVLLPSAPVHQLQHQGGAGGVPGDDSAYPS